MDLEDTCHNNSKIELMRLKEFPALNGITYMDHAGTTLAARSQLEAHHKDIIENIYGNPHSQSPSSQLTTDTIDQIRYRILKYFNTSLDEYTVIFTSGCTGALKIIAESFDFQGYHCSCEHDGKVLVENQEMNDNITAVVKDLSNSAAYKEGLLESKNLFDLSNCNESKRVCSCHGNNTSCCYNNGSINQPQRGSFIYLLDNHTSVQGMREISFSRAGCVSCIDCDKANVITEEHVVYQGKNYQKGGNCLFAYPAQSNFSGQKYPMEWISKSQNGNLGSLIMADVDKGHCHVLLDAACLVSTSSLDLGDYQPDFVTLSFYKMFGYPTGLGALLVRNKSSHLLKKRYYGGGTVAVSLPTERFHVLRSSLAERFEDGTVSFLDIISLRHGFQVLESLAGGIAFIASHTFSLAQYFYNNLRSLQHSHGRALAEIYCHGNFDDPDTQGAIVTFNCLRQNGDYIGFSEVDKLAQLHNIHIRTGCFCNLGACQKFLKISNEELKRNFDAGHVCGDDKDLINGRPTGAVRVSFGYMSTLQDANTCLQFLVDCFLESPDKPVFMKKIWKNQPISTGNEKSKTHSKDSDMKQLTDKFFPDRKNTEKKSVTSNIESNKYPFDKISNLDKPFHACSIDETMPKQSSSSDAKSNAELETLVPKVFSVSGDSRVNSTEVSNPTIEKETGDNLGSSFVNENISEPVPASSRILTDIFVYPIKSCAAFKAQKWQLSDRGLLYDREWMIVMESGVGLSLKRETRLCLLQPLIDLDLQKLVLHYPGVEPVSVPLVYEDSTVQEISLCSGKVCGDKVQSIDCGQVVSDWLSKVLERQGCRLIRQRPDETRISKLKHNDSSGSSPSRITLANESQYLLLNRATVDILREKIKETGDSVVDGDSLLHRFRGNLVVAGGNPFEEETWQSVQIGSVCLKSQGLCTRCQMVCFDPQTGERSKEPLKTLATWRNKKMTFGVYFCCCEDYSSGIKMIQVGDPVTPS